MTETTRLPSPGAAGQGPDYRPLLHYTAADTWLNDPNGLVYDDGTYHLFYQNNPYANVWGNMSWGHATSTDLLAWTEHPIAITCDDREDVFSGSIVVDHLNTSGFGSAECPPWVAVYTSAFKEPSVHRGTQAQSLAYSLDRGMTWTKYAGNPVLTRHSADFRDPKVFWYSGPAGSHWVMAAVEARQNMVVFYGSGDLREWTLLSEFGPAHASGGEWECPDLFPLPVDNDPTRAKWVLTVNINPGAVAGGSGGQYFIGEFDGVRFRPDALDPEPGDDEGTGSQGQANPLRRYQWMDWGRDYYAAVSFSNVPDNRRVMIGWMNNWDYANQIPTAPWRSAMTLARDVSLVTIEGKPTLVQRPVLPPLPPQEPLFQLDNVELTDDRLELPDAPPGCAQIIRAQFRPGSAGRIGFVLRGSASGEGEERSGHGRTRGTVLAYDIPSGELVLDRRHSGDTGFHPLFASAESCPVRLRDGVLTLEIIVDRSSVEVFAQHGEATITDLIFPDPRDGALAVFAENGKATLVSLEVRTIG
ncbi:glycoside hydrolase family 32 protein [Arthrobacter sp. NPDC093139]|uniref:glycoside hydrolase family 32 protein n=1 Tax=Arthrobacter sp. NPDC093139 TaxID=3363945 RepID=UPI00382A4172